MSHITPNDELQYLGVAELVDMLSELSSGTMSVDASRVNAIAKAMKANLGGEEITGADDEADREIEERMQ